MEQTVFEQFTEMKKLWDEFETNHKIFEEKENKSAAARARKAVNSLKKLITNYKQASSEHVKSL